MLPRSQNKMYMMWSSVWLKQNRAAVVNQWWCALRETGQVTAGEEHSLQREHEQAFSLNAFALKHVSLFKEEHSSWMMIGAFVRLSTPHFVTDSCIMYRFCLGVQTSLFSVEYEFLQEQLTVFGWQFWDWHNLHMWVWVAGQTGQVQSLGPPWEPVDSCHPEEMLWLLLPGGSLLEIVSCTIFCVVDVSSEWC